MPSCPRAARLLAGFAAVSVAALAGAHDLSWYDASEGTLPTEQCWEYIVQDADIEPTMDGDAAHLGPTTLTARAYWRRSLTPFLADDGASVSVQASVISSSYIQNANLRRSGFSITMTDDAGRWARLGVSKNRLVLQTTQSIYGDKVLVRSIDEAMHDFRLQFFDGAVVASMDGAAVLSANAGFGGDHPNTVTVGDTTGWGHSETLTATILIESVPLCSGPDLDCDGAVDGGDLATLLSTWGDAACRTDLDGDGVTGSGDLAILLAAWG